MAPGTAWYVSTKLVGEDLRSLIATVLAEAGTPITELPTGLETVVRSNESTDFSFFINHADAAATVSLPSASGTDARTGEPVGADITVPAAGFRVIASPRT